MEKTVSAVLVAAGSSTRRGVDKLSFDLGGETVLHRSIRAFAQCPQITELVLVAGKNREFVAQQAADCPKPVQIVVGGATRAESAKIGVLAAHGELVAVHDAARPFVSEQVITDALAEAEAMGAAAPAVAGKDTIKIANDGAVVQTPDRAALFAVQAPQCFCQNLYWKALEAVQGDKVHLVTDDCSLFELAGLPVHLTQGDYAYYKITTREDLPRPEQKEEHKMRIGHGYDAHRFADNRRLIIGGIEIPHTRGLDGHSGADVLTHAVMDALLGALALGDIGSLFPDSDPAYAGADSVALLVRVADLISAQGWRVGYIDATVIAQAPKIKPYIDQRRARIAKACGARPEDVSVKATTEEHTGFSGREEGIRAHAGCLLERSG